MSKGSPMRALVLCEVSGVWSRELFVRGYDVLQADLGAYGLGVGECRDMAPGWRVQRCDIRSLSSTAGTWDVVCAFPPCTDLSACGAHLWWRKWFDGSMAEAVALGRYCGWMCRWARVAGLLENPQGLMRHALGVRESLQVHPWEYDCGGENVKKRTCLWLWGWVPPMSRWGGSEAAGSFVDRVGSGRDQKRIRSESWRGMARAWVGTLPRGGAR